MLALAAYLAGMRVQNVLGASLFLGTDLVLTVAWYVALMNAFNLIDGVDGLAAGVALIAAIGVALSLAVRQVPGDVMLLLGFAGACAGFLRYNFYPARVFLGETGSLFIGYTFAALAISTQSKGPAVASLGIPMLAAGVPLFDAALAVWRRSVRHWGAAAAPEGGTLARVARADADHIHHRLLRAGGGHHSRVALILYGATAALAVVGLLVSVFNDRAIGLLSLTFLIGAYVVVRHLLWLELRETGEAVLRGLARPVRRNQTLIIHVLGDAVILNGVFLLAATLLNRTTALGLTDARALWRIFAAVDVGLPFLALVLMRCYSRLWYLARTYEFFICGLAVVVGYASAFAVQIIGWGPELRPVELATHYLFMAGLAVPLIVSTRAGYRIALDLVQRFAHTLERDGRRRIRALICGVGHRATLFIQQVALTQLGGTPIALVGMVDADDALLGHYVHGVPVLGDYDALPELVREARIEAVYVVEDIGAENERRIREALRGASVRLIRWRVVEEEMPAGS